MTVLQPMRTELFESFAQACIASYADNNVQVGRWRAATAMQRARNEFERLLPQGLQTPNHFIYEITDEAKATNVGFLWFAIIGAGETRAGYVYSILVNPEFRGRGHAKAALDLIEPIARAEGLSGIALHVFSFNTSAQALYRSSGYGITGFNMHKPLQREGD